MKRSSIYFVATTRLCVVNQAEKKREEGRCHCHYHYVDVDNEVGVEENEVGEKSYYDYYDSHFHHHYHQTVADDDLFCLVAVVFVFVSAVGRKET